MRKNLEVDVPKDADTEVQRVRGLKKSIFTRTRIATLSLVLVLALSVSSTLAFEKWTGNQTPNRGNLGKVEINIGERINASAAQNTSNWNQVEPTYSFGNGKKVVCFRASDNANEAESSLTVALIPQAESDGLTDTSTPPNTVDDAFITLAGTWGELQSEEVDDQTYYFIETTAVKVYVTNIGEGDDQWTWANGCFSYNSTLKKGEYTSDLVTGVVLKDTVNASDYKSTRLQIITRGVNVVETTS